MVNQKCERWAQALVDSLSAILGSLYTVTKAFDANSDVYVKVALAAGGNNSVKAIVKLAPAAPPASGKYDSLGLAQTVYSPHVASIAFDITTPFSTGTTEKERAIVDWQVVTLGTHVDWYSKAVGAGNLAVTDIDVANFVAGVDNIDTRNGTLSNL
jgi:hypothetical protein